MLVFFRDKEVEVPACVDELSAGQYEYFVYLAAAMHSGGITPVQFRLRWLSYLLGLGSIDYTMLSPEYIGQAEKIKGRIMSGYLSETHETDGTVTVKARFDSCMNKLREYHGYKGPGDWLDGLSYGDFTKCLAIISGDGSAETYEEIARVLYHIPEPEAVPGLLTFHAPMLFANVWYAIQSGPVEINGNPIDFSIIFKPSKAKAKPDDHTGWIGITFELAQDGPFGNVRQVEESGMWEVLLYLYKCKFEYLHETK